jgi:hypothetical protein
MGLYQKANDLAIRLNGKEGAEARMHALAISEALDEKLSALVQHAEYQSQMLKLLVDRNVQGQPGV